MCSRIVRLVVVFLFFFSVNSQAAVPSPDWKTLETEHFLIHFLPSYSQQAKRSALISEKIYLQMQQRFDWQPETKISMVLTDEYDAANGSATPYPYNLVNLRLFPPDSAGSLDDYDDWLTLLIEHELTHTFHTDKGRGKIIKLRNTFGRFLLFFPNILQPAWLIEGLATHLETHPGIGRGQSSSFEMLMREEVRRGILPVSQVNLPPDSQPLSRPYLYGVYFYQFLEARYGESAIYELVENYSDNFLPFAINSNSKQVLGKDITELWSEFITFLHQRFSGQIEILNNSGLEEGHVLQTTNIRPTQIEVLKDGSVLYIEDTQESEARLVRLNNDELEELAVVNADASFAIAKNNIVYISQPDLCDEYRYFYDLYKLDVLSGSLEQLTKCARYKHVVVNAAGQLIAVRTEASKPQIDLLDAKANKIKTLWRGQYGDVINQIDLSEKRNALLVTRKQLNAGWGVFEFKLDSLNWETLINDGSVNVNAKYTEADEAVLFSSNKTGIYNIYHFKFSDQSVKALTHVDSGAFHPVEALDNKIIYLNFNPEGYQLFSTDASQKKTVTIKNHVEPVVRYQESMLESVTDYPVREYQPWPDLKPKYWLPVFNIQDKGSELGFASSSSDSLDHHYYELNLAYGVDQQELVGSLFYRYQNWLGMLWSKENSFFSDDADNTTLIRTNTQTQLSLNKSFTSVKQLWNIKLGLIGNNDQDSYRAAGVSGFGDNYDDLLGISVYYVNKRQYLKSHSPEQGRDVLLVTESSDVFKSDYQGQLTTLEWQEFFKLGQHHVIALRYVAGAADITMRPYTLGGLKTEWDDLAVFNPQYSRDIFNKRYFALRGYNDNTQVGNNIELLSLEYRFPLQQVERGIMVPPVGLIKHSGRLFTEAGASWNDSEKKDVISSAGIEWVVDANLLYFYNFQLRLGYAKGLDEPGDEFYYLKLGTAF